MSDTNTHSLKHLKRQSKDSLFKTQLHTIFQYLKDNTATATMVSDATGVPQKSICRYKRDLEKNGLLIELLKTHCKITGCKAWYLTTNKLLFINQSKTI
jgi:hypothetical protein